jgi:hypothetical protein
MSTRPSKTFATRANAVTSLKAKAVAKAAAA